MPGGQYQFFYLTTWDGHKSCEIYQKKFLKRKLPLQICPVCKIYMRVTQAT